MYPPNMNQHIPYPRGVGIIQLRKSTTGRNPLSLALIPVRLNGALDEDIDTSHVAHAYGVPPDVLPSLFMIEVMPHSAWRSRITTAAVDVFSQMVASHGQMTHSAHDGTSQGPIAEYVAQLFPCWTHPWLLLL